MSLKLIQTLLLSSVLVMSVVAMSLQTADALTKGSGSYNQKTRHKNVCGDRLCTEPAAQPQPKVMEEEKKEQKMMKEEKMMKEPMRMAHEMKTKSGTLTSVQDPGQGHESHQLAIILPPSDNVYKGILSYSASENIQLVALHGPLAPGEDAGQAIWTPDGKTKFALTFVDPDNSMGTWVFSGNALAVHTMNTEPFQVSYSVVASQ
ncbi:MAG: hypothetical protein ACT4N1_02425 [Nitrososphaerota archaeon]